MSTVRTGPGGVLRWHFDYGTASPELLILQHPFELMPALIQNCPVKACLGSDMPAGFLYGPFSRCGHVGHLQILHYYHSVVFAYGSAGFVKVVVTGIGYTDVQPRQYSFLFPPVTGSFDLPERFLCSWAAFPEGT